MRDIVREYLAALDALHLADSSIAFAECEARLRAAERRLRTVA